MTATFVLTEDSMLRSKCRRGSEPPPSAGQLVGSSWLPSENEEASCRRSWRPSALSSGEPSAKLLALPVPELGQIRARSAAMQSTLGLIARFAPAEVTITLIGETGTGKDVLSHLIHSNSARSSGPIVVLDCGSLAASLAESEVLGHERGAFTGAISSHAGAFERAEGGTLFLDEIGELPLELQPRLLRAIDNRHGRRVGGTKERVFDVRIVAATNRDLRQEVALGRFRQDLFFRLGAAIIPVPPLRERLDDLPLLVSNLLAELGVPELEVTDAAYGAMCSHRWPGNVRELKNTLACAVALVRGTNGPLDAHHIAAVIHVEPDLGARTVDQLPLGGMRLEEIERAAILQTLAQTEGNKVRAAHLLGIAVSTLYEKLKKYGPEEPYAFK